MRIGFWFIKIGEDSYLLLSVLGYWW